MALETLVRNLIVPDVDTIGPNERVRDARRRMQGESRRSLVVVDDGRPVGVIAWRSIMRESEVSGDEPVLTYMITDFPVFTPDMTIGDARARAAGFGDVDVDHFPVVDEQGRYIGEIDRGHLAHGDTDAAGTSSGRAPDAPVDVPVREGMTVRGSAGKKLGVVSEVLIEPSGQFTAFLVEHGLLSKKHKRIPADTIDRVEGDTVVLAIDKIEFDMLANIEDAE